MRLRLFLSLAFIGLVSAVGVVLIARQNTTTAVRAFMLRGGMTESGGLVESLEAYYQNHRSWDGVETLFNVRGGRGQGYMGGMIPGMGRMMNQRLRLADVNGKILVDTATSFPSGFLDRSEKSNAIEIQTDGQVIGYLVAEGGMSINQRDETFLVDRLTKSALTAGLIAAGVALFLSLLLAYSLLRPIRELTQAARRLGEGDLSQRVRVKGSDEITILANTFNNMAGSLQKAEDSRRAMTADIAHELRSPLAIQRAHLEAMQDGIYPLTSEMLDPVLEQNQLLTRLVEDLRTLALADAGELKLELASVDIAELINRIAVRFEPQAARYDVKVILDNRIDAAAPTIIRMDPMRFEQVLGNLLSNALRHSPKGGHIILSMDVIADRITVSVRDNGPGILDEAIPYIFDRFYRVDRSRSRQEGGAGLGLAIARKLVEAHGGTITASNHPQGGALFTINLPITK